ncbi:MULTISPECIES: MFS transporter [unclassified Nocardia]|uniref:MFS transporter n=1 Tax=unclassified Nocardia TaxID=2637762 RepID=UPI001CE49CDF|nr:MULTISPECIES: MFS transporter [unclassified Nocardia]
MTVLAKPEPLSRNARIAALVALCLAELLVVLDNTLVNVALPTMAVRLHAYMSGLQWIVDAFTLAFAGLLLAMGHLGDRYGRRRMMLIGLSGVAVMSAVGALSTGLGQVIAARAGMGVFAAAVYPSTLAMITNIFTDARERAQAIAAWSAMAGIAIALGPTVGGWLLGVFSWHAVFWINIPIALVTIVAIVTLTPESRADHGGRLDIVGLALSLIGVTSLVYTIIAAPRWGWLSTASLAGYAISVVLLVLFVAWELRVAAPVLDVRLFRNPRFAVPAFAITVSFFSGLGFLFLFTQYFQGIKELSAFEFGVHSLPFAAAVCVAAPAATLLAQRIGATAVIVTGLALMAAAMAMIMLITVDTPYLGPVLVTMVVLGVGFAVVQGPATDSIMASVPVEQAGAGSAVNDTTRETGGALGVAVLGSVMASVYTARVGARIDAVPSALMTAQQKDLARHSPISVVDIAAARVSPFLAGPRDDLVRAIKVAAMTGAHLSAAVTVVVLLISAITVAVLLPWRPERTDDIGERAITDRDREFATAAGDSTRTPADRHLVADPVRSSRGLPRSANRPRVEVRRRMRLRRRAYRSRRRSNSGLEKRR